MRHAERQREENQRPGALWPDISPANTTSADVFNSPR